MNRQQALNQLRIMQAWHEDFGNGPCPDYDAICYAINIIEEAPEGLDNLIKALEQEHKKLREMQKAQPERKKGKWTNENACEFCGFQPWYERDIHTLSFCPNCGADMRGEQDG